MLTALPVGQVHAQKLVELSAGQRTAMVNVSIGKSADVRTDIAFTDVTVGDPEIADVNVLTDRSLSILRPQERNDAASPPMAKAAGWSASSMSR